MDKKRNARRLQTVERKGRIELVFRVGWEGRTGTRTKKKRRGTKEKNEGSEKPK